MGVGAGPEQTRPEQAPAERREDEEEVWARGSARSGAIRIATPGRRRPRTPCRLFLSLFSTTGLPELSRVGPPLLLPFAPRSVPLLAAPPRLGPSTLPPKDGKQLRRLIRNCRGAALCEKALGSWRSAPGPDGTHTLGRALCAAFLSCLFPLVGTRLGDLPPRRSLCPALAPAELGVRRRSWQGHGHGKASAAVGEAGGSGAPGKSLMQPGRQGHCPEKDVNDKNGMIIK